MGTAQVLSELRALGVTIEHEGPDLYLEPFSLVPDILLAQVRGHKPEIIGLLIGPCRWCAGILG